MQHEYFLGEKQLGGRLKPKVFSDVRKSIVVATTDVMLINEHQQLLLGLRDKPPSNIWWIFGGRMLAGETFIESARRCLKAEFGLTPRQGDLIHLGFYSLYWNLNHYTDHALLVGYALKVRESDIKVRPRDHKSVKWIGFNEVLAGDFPPGLKQMVIDYQSLLDKN